MNEWTTHCGCRQQVIQINYRRRSVSYGHDGDTYRPQVGDYTNQLRLKMSSLEIDRFYEI